MARVNPPDNGRGPIRFMRTFEDEITGMQHTEEDLVRDLDGRLRYSEDVDAPDRGHLSEGFAFPEDRSDDEPPLE